MTDEDVIAHTAQILGQSYYRWKPKNEKHKTNYIVHLKGHRAVELMRELYPLMGERRKGQIDRALENFIYKPHTKGEFNSQSKLTEDQVKEIKRRLAQGDRQTRIAAAFGISQRAISDIKCGNTWSHVSLDD